MITQGKYLQCPLDFIMKCLSAAGPWDHNAALPAPRHLYTCVCVCVCVYVCVGISLLMIACLHMCVHYCVCVPSISALSLCVFFIVSLCERIIELEVLSLGFHKIFL